tara:strand:+ start:1015 stop:1737 length:723 start_codon:yes stop_codon:yes gene_type:complete
MASPIKQRIQVHQDWTGDIPLKNLWGVYFAPRAGSASMTQIGENIRETIADYQPGAFQVEIDLIDRFSSNDEGYLLAQGVSMPTENVQINTTDIPGAGGFINGYYGETRGKYGTNGLSIDFLETNIDIFDFFIKPWIVATSYKGLIEDISEPDIKCNISIAQYTRTDAFYGDKRGSSQNTRRDSYNYGVRKITNFFNCAPTSMAADQMSYGEITESDIKRSVGWTFSHYDINIPRLGYEF